MEDTLLLNIAWNAEFSNSEEDMQVQCHYQWPGMGYVKRESWHKWEECLVMPEEELVKIELIFPSQTK